MSKFELRKFSTEEGSHFVLVRNCEDETKTVSATNIEPKTTPVVNVESKKPPANNIEFCYRNRVLFTRQSVNIIDMILKLEIATPSFREGAVPAAKYEETTCCLCSIHEK